MLQITVYKRTDAFRVVAGTHTPHADSKAYKVTVYADAPLAYTAETDPAIRAAIARVAPEAATLIAPLPPIRCVPLSAAVIGKSTRCPGSGQWPRSSEAGNVCPDCGRIFARDELRGRDEHMPEHMPVSGLAE